MKFQADRSAIAITAHGPGWIVVGGQKIGHSVLLDESGNLDPWDCARFEDLHSHHFALLAARQPEVVLFGSGARLRFPRPPWVRPLVEAGIGIETMDTIAACRTFNILAGEGRRVIAALLLETEAQATSRATSRDEIG